MVSYTILAGGFTTFIASYVFNPDAKTLTLVKQTTTGANPSWIASHPRNASILYATNEVGPVGNLQSFIVRPDAGLTLVDTVATGGNGPTFTNPLSTGEVSAMNFGSPNSAFIATNPQDPTKFIASPVVNFPVGGGPSNPHMSLEHNGEVFVPDLGADKIWRLANAGKPGQFKVQGQINIDKGAGPRHIAISNNILFTVHEKSSTLTAQAIPQGPNGTTFPLIANVSTVPPGQPAGSKFAAAEILISQPTAKFPNPLIYVSNRNIATQASSINPQGDSIAIFEFVSATTPAKPRVARMMRFQRSIHNDEEKRQAQAPAGTLVLRKQVFTGLQQIRSMSLGKVANGGDEFLMAGATTTGGVAMFRRVDGGKDLQLVARNTDLPSRTSFVFL